MRTIGEGIKDAVGSVFCFNARIADGVGGLLANLPINIGGIQTQLDRYRAFACGDDPMDSSPVGIPPLFSGGQCDGVAYLYTYKLSGRYSNGVVTEHFADGILTGAVSGFRFEQEFYTQASNNQQQVLIRMYGTASSGEALLKVITGLPAELVDYAESVPRMQRADNQADTCGNPPSAPPEPLEEVDDELDITYDDPFGNPVTIPDVPIKFFKPCINLDGIRVPFELNTPFGKVCGKVGISPDFPDIIEPSVDIDLCPEQRQDLGYGEEQIKDFFEFLPALGAPVNFPDVDLAGTLSSNWNIDDPPILGAFIRGRKTQPQGGGKTIVLKEPSSSTPNIIIPRIGTIFFEYLVKKENGYDSAFSEDIPIKNVNQFIPCPWDFGATRVHFKNEIGWEFSVFPVARKSCCESCASNDPKKLDDLDRCRID